MEKLLKNVGAVGDFSVGGHLNTSIVHPGLDVNGFGQIGLPLHPLQIQELIKICEQAPFGMMDKTIVDTSIRNTWQLSPSQFQITNPKLLII
jgi:hypothetical protein